MKIKSFAGGGIAYLPTTNRRKEAAQTAAASSSSNTPKVPGFADKIIDNCTDGHHYLVINCI